jgi:hypothetical protein
LILLWGAWYLAEGTVIIDSASDGRFIPASLLASNSRIQAASLSAIHVFKLPISWLAAP